MNPKKLLMVGLVAFLAGAACLGQQTDAPGPQKLRVSQGVMAGQLIHRVEPVYPEAAKSQGISGAVVVKLQIDTEGHVAQTEIVSGDALLTEAAVNAVMQWQFKTYQLNGEPVAVETTATVYVGPSPPRKLSVSQGVMAGNLVHKVDPDYPVEAKADHIQGDVILRATIDREGKIVELKSVQGDPLLVEAALKAVKQWKYKPFLLDGVPLEVESQVTVNFTLEE